MQDALENKVTVYSLRFRILQYDNSLESSENEVAPTKKPMMHSDVQALLNIRFMMRDRRPSLPSQSPNTPQMNTYELKKKQHKTTF